jgi:hypothetical protein
MGAPAKRSGSSGGAKRSKSSGGSGFGSRDDATEELRREVASLKAQLADALQTISELKAHGGLGLDAAQAERATSAEPPAGRIRALRQVSSHPLVFTIDDFVDKAACEALRRQSPDDSKDAQLHFATLVAGELFAGQWGARDGLRFNSAASSDANNDGAARVSYPDGLHVDTNNEATFRSVTMILYLNDIDESCGGATAFPMADASADDPAVVAAGSLLGEGVTHTRGAVTAGGVVPAGRACDAALLESRVDDSVLRVQPQAGRLCIFFSRTSDGAIDQYSWHGGERLRGEGTGKHILTLFKEVHYGAGGPEAADPNDGGGGSLEAYLAPQIAEQRRYLEDLAKAHESYFA